MAWASSIGVHADNKNLMPPRPPFTQEEKQWLIENHSHLNNGELRSKLRCGYKSLRQLVAELGLTWKTIPEKKEKKERKVRLQHKDEGANLGYCIDCKRYVRGGRCSKTGKDVGALWQKKCSK